MEAIQRSRSYKFQVSGVKFLVAGGGVGLLLRKVDPQIWAGYFLILGESGIWTEYIHSRFRVDAHWSVTLMICGFRQAIYGVVYLIFLFLDIAAV